jgi:uncharacterized protein YicC (UPF0701 family)
MAIKLDISEEIARMDSHIRQFRKYWTVMI